MSPWNIIGWLLVVAILLPVAFFLIVTIVGSISHVLGRRRLKMAHGGKVSCQHDGCNDVAVRETPNGFYCADHFMVHSEKRTTPGNSIAYAHMLNHANKQEEK